MASESSLEKGAHGEHNEIFPDDGIKVMGTTQLNDESEILLVPAPSADPRGAYILYE
jgi:hypothetical protein